MTAVDTGDRWSDINQRALVGHFARLKQLLQHSELAAPPADAGTEAEGIPAIDILVAAFELSSFERDVLLLCAGVEMDAELARLCRTGAEGTSPSFGVALATLQEPHWSALTPVAPLRRWRLVEPDDALGLTRGRLRIDERILHYLAGINYLDRRLEPFVSPKTPPAALAASHRSTSERVFAGLGAARTLPLVHLVGDDRYGQAAVAAEIASRLELRLHVVRSSELPASPAELDALAVLWQREATLLGSALLIDTHDGDDGRLPMRFVERLRGLLFIASRQPLALDRPSLRASVDRPGPSEQRDLWSAALGDNAARFNGALAGVASQFRFSAQTIYALAPALRAGLDQSPEPDALLWSACRRLGRTALDELAQRIDVGAGPEDLVLPAAQQAQLRQIAAHARHRLTVHGDWGFGEKSARGLGISALFAGESGTGKTMAAEVLAGELHLDLYRIDLSAVVSKYIGESEKNLRKVFDAAEDSGAILLFDEADALFGKRSDVKDSHDRYANIEVGYLLQRMEAYRGLAILTTNLKNALDSAFQRRLRFVVQFSFPDRDQRRLIWRRIFPPATPLGAIDYDKLARLDASGGTIRNIALSAAFLAVAAGEPVGMQHLLQAARSEALKRDLPLSESEVRGWV